MFGRAVAALVGLASVPALAPSASASEGVWGPVEPPATSGTEPAPAGADGRGVAPSTGLEAEPVAASSQDASSGAVGALPDSAWQALVGSQIVVTRTDGARVSGKLLGVDPTTVTIVGPDGRVMVVARTDVEQVQQVAEQAEASPEASETPATKPSTTDARTPMSKHRGFFMAGGAGFGIPVGRAPYEGVTEPYDGTERILGPGLNLGFLIGGAPRPGLVLGFALDTNVGRGWHKDDWTTPDGYSGIDDYDGGVYSVASSLFVQGYMRNFFIRGGLGGMGLFFVDDGSSDGDESTGGMGVDFAVGLHVPVARKAAIGFSAGLRTAFWRFDDDYTGSWQIFQPQIRFETVLF